MNIERNEKIIQDSIIDLLNLKRDTLIIKNISKLDKLMNILYEELSKYNFDREDMIGKSKIYSIEERLNYVKQFYNRHNINFDIDKIVRDGTIGFIYDAPSSVYSETQYENEIDKMSKYNPNLFGYQFFENEKNLINVKNTGYLFDSVILTHEISHYRNQFKPINEISDLFTEVLAFTECTIMAKETLNPLEYQYYLKSQYYGYNYFAANNHLYFDFLNLYQTTGKINYENYCLMFGKISIADYCDKLEKILNDKIDVFNAARYVIAGLLVPYLINKYEYNNDFFNTIEELNDIINSNDMNKIMFRMGIFNTENNFVNNYNINILIENLNIYLEREMRKGVVK